MIICLLSVEIEHAMDYDYQQPDLFWCKLKCPNTQWWHSTACMSERHVSSTAGQKATRVWCYHYSMEAPHHVACCMDMRSQEQCTRSLGHLSSGVQSSSCFKCVRLSKILQAKLYPKHMALGYGLENCNPITTNLLMLLASDCITILCLYVAVADCTIVELMAKKMPCSPPAGLAIFLFLDSTLHSTAARIYTTEWRVSIAATPGGGCGCYGYPQSASPSPISTHFTPPHVTAEGGRGAEPRPYLVCTISNFLNSGMAALRSSWLKVSSRSRFYTTPSKVSTSSLCASCKGVCAAHGILPRGDLTWGLIIN